MAPKAGKSSEATDPNAIAADSLARGPTWPVLSSLVVVVLFLDACALTWYLWRLPQDSLSNLQKTLTMAGGWITAIFGFLGIQYKVKRQPNWPNTLKQLPTVLLTVAVSALVWFLILPVHSLEIRVAGPGGPLEAPTATLSGEDHRSGGPDGVVRVSGLAAANYILTLSCPKYVAKKAGFSFTDVLGFTTPPPVLLEHAKGTLRVSSNPSGAAYQVDGTPRGQTPDEIGLPSGTHSVRVELPDYLPLEKPALEIEEGKSTVFEATLLKKIRVLPRYRVQIESRYRDTQISIDTKLKGVCPLGLSLTAGEHTITAHRGAAEMVKTITLPTGASTTYVTFDFQAK